MLIGGLALGVLLLLGVGVVTLRSPVRVVLPVYAALVPFGSAITLPVGLPAPFNTLTTLVGLVVVAILTLQVLLVGTGPRLHPSVPAWLLFVGLCGLTFAWSVDPGATREGLMVLVSLAALYVVAVLVKVTQTDVARLRDGIVVGGTLACAYGFYLLFTGGLPEEDAGLPRFATAGGVGDDADPNITAAVLLLPFVLAVWRAMGTERPLVRVSHGGAATVIGIGILLTGSRGGVLAVTLAIVVLITQGRHRGRASVAAAVLLGLVGVTAFALAPEQVARLERPGSSGRTGIWHVGVVACEAHCLVGSGLNTFPEVHQSTKLSSPEAGGPRLEMKPHNIWLGTGVEVGLAGVVLLAVALAATAWPLGPLPRSRRGAPLAGLAGVMAANFFLANLSFKYFWLALLYAAYEAIAEPDPSERSVADAPSRLPAVPQPA